MFKNLSAINFMHKNWLHYFLIMMWILSISFSISFEIVNYYDFLKLVYDDGTPSYITYATVIDKTVFVIDNFN